MDYLIDSAIIIDLLRNYPPAIHWAQENDHLILGIAPFVWIEIIEGAINKSARDRAERLMNRFEMVYPSQEDINWAMRQLHQYNLSHNVGLIDCLIAAPSSRLQLPLYTRNLKHFTPILGDLAQQPY